MSDREQKGRVLAWYVVPGAKVLAETEQHIACFRAFAEDAVEARTRMRVVTSAGVTLEPTKSKARYAGAPHVQRGSCILMSKHAVFCNQT